MLVSERFEGNTPFEGDRLLTLRSLPEGAQVTSATVTLTPVSPPGGALFEERITFSGTQGEWGARLRESTTADDPRFVEVDFHARRTLSNVVGTNLNGAGLQVDIGGLYVQINELGAMTTPDDGVDDFTLPSYAGGTLPALATQKFKLTRTPPTQPHITEVGIRTTPSNLTLRLASQPPFWARPGELAQPETTLDFSVILNAFLGEAQAKDGFYELPLTLHSDSLCRLEVRVAIEFVQKQAALPDGLTETALSFDHSTLPQGEAGVISVQLPPGARVLAGQTTARVRGSFANSRVVYGPTGKVDAAGVVNVSPERAEASPLVFSENVALSSLDFLLTSTSRTAELAIDLVEDLDGKPGTQSTLPAQAKVGIDSQIAGKPTWVNVALPVEVQIKAGTRIWLVVQSLNGEAAWSVVTQASVTSGIADGSWTAGGAVATDQANGTPLGILYTDTGGLSWRAETAPGVTGTLAAMVHLRQPAAGYQVPIALQVGDGDAAQRVSLDRFQPLGRVDFNLDFAEFAEAINQVASASGSTAIPSGEHLLNNEFETWRRVGDTPRARAGRVPAGTGIARTIATSPDSDLLFVANDQNVEGSFIRIAIVSTGCHELQAEIPVREGPFYAMAVSPEGRRACVLQDDVITWVDLEGRVVLGSLEGDLIARIRPVFTPDGALIYFLTSEAITGYDVNVLEKVFTGNAQLSEAVVNRITLEEGWQPVAQVLSSDGTRLFVGILEPGEGDQTAEVWGIDLTTQTGTTQFPVGTVSNPEMPLSLALNPAGTRLVVTNRSAQEVGVFETRVGQRIGTISTGEAIEPIAAAVDPGGQLSYVLCRSFSASGEPSAVLQFFDLSRTSQGFLRPAGAISTEIPVGNSPVDLAILPSGERLYVASEFGSNQKGMLLPSLALGAMTPEEWTVTAGKVQPVCVEAPYHRAAVLGDFICLFAFDRVEAVIRRGIPENLSSSGLSQVIRVVGGVRYELSFWGLATSQEVVAEVIWHGADCGVQQTDRIPFTAFEGGADDLKCGLDNLINTTEVVDVGPYILSHRLAMTSPSGAEQAEVRFTAPANEAAFLDRVSLQATANTLSNGDLQHLEDSKLAGWTLNPSVAGVTLAEEADGLRFRNASGREVALEQTATFSAQVPFEVTFVGRGEASGSGAVPRVEVVWQGTEGVRVGTPLVIPLPAEASDRAARRGDSPVGTASAKVRVVVPSGANLLLKTVNLEEVNLTNVPIYVIAQAPGDLNVSGLQVVYEVAPPAPPRTPPANGLCTPTAPAASGSGKRGCCYCPNCGETDDLCDLEEMETAGGQPVLEGECCHCGAKVQQIGGGGTRVAPAVKGAAPVVVRATGRARGQTTIRANAVRAAGIVRANVVQTPAGMAFTPRAVVQPEKLVVRAPVLPAITEVTRVTAEIANALKVSEFGTLDKLAAATPSEIAAVLPENLQAEAKYISRNARNLLKRVEEAG